MTGQLTKSMEKQTAVLFDIQRFSINDGPGVRTNLFFKGCPLRCIWCHNPESYLFQKQLSFRPASCTGCMECMKVCPNGASYAKQKENKWVIAVDYQDCTACGECLQVCCYDARTIVGKEYTIEELKKRVATDIEYYRIKDAKGNTGGITLTGGEPMSQFAFIEQFLNELNGIHICMETSGYAPSWQFERLLKKVDLYLFDYKATDPALHKQLCGVDNRLILENLKFLCENQVPVILRLPLIPGVNDDDDHLQAAAKIIEKYPNIIRGEVMAYHNLGEAKAENIGIAECLGIVRYNGKSAGKEQREKWLEKLRSFGAKNIKLG